MEPLVLSRSLGGVCRLTFNRPNQRNAMSVEMCTTFYRELRTANEDPEIRCIVLDGAGEHFMAGGDVKSWARLQSMEPAERGEDFRVRMKAVAALVEYLAVMHKPLIVAVRGYSVGAALCFILAADFVLADTTAKFIFGNIRVGLVPDMGITYYLPRVVGRRAALRLTMLGSQLDATQALDVGMIDEIVAVDALEGAIGTLTEKLVSAPATAIQETKALLQQSLHNTLTTQFAAEVEGLAVCAAQDDFMEAVVAFAERRAPQFRRST
jgi:2-(1,2-epoxy-1,2-dihydrophenyl)acetyl-CoA isomerase